MSDGRDRRPGLTVPLLGSAAAAVGGLIWVTVVEPRAFALRRVDTAVLRPPASRPLRVLHLSDLHVQPRGRAGPLSRLDALQAFLDRCAVEEPDLVVLTGDVLGHPAVVDDAIALLAPLVLHRPGLVSLGSNDRYGPTIKNPFKYFWPREQRREVHGDPMPTDRLVTGLAASGWTVVENRRAIVDTAAGPVDVAGLGDAHIDADHPGSYSWAPPPQAVVLRLGVAHAPYRRVLDRYAAAGYDLVLSGHTHGGQVRVPGYGALVTNCDLPPRQARGLSTHDELPLHVSAGLGMSRYAPFRFACRPEATLLELRPRTSQPRRGHRTAA